MFGYSEISRRLTSIESRLRDMMSLLIEVDEKLDRVVFSVNRPNPLDVKVLKEDNMIRFGIILPVRPAKDEDWNEISRSILTVKIPGKDLITLNVQKGDQLTEDRILRDSQLAGAQGDKCRASFAYVDNANNVGSAVELDFELVDTVPPVGPTQLGVAMLEEIPDPAPEPEPEPQPDDTQPIPEPTPDTPPVDGETIE
jgi:hypothetical protein